MSKKDLTPSRFTHWEGGCWDYWVHGPVTLNDLQKRDKKHVKINGIELHSLSFAKLSEEIYDPKEQWDCISGWRK